MFLAVALASLMAAANLRGYLNADSSWVLSLAERWISGEKLYSQVVENNPPLVVYLTAIPVLAAHLFGISSATAFVLFVTFLGLISLALACAVTRDSWLRAWALAALVLLPGVSFGQREHLFLLLFTPYFLMFLAPSRPRASFVYAIALMAAVGIALKPYFLLFWFALLLTELLITRQPRRIFRVENFLIAAVLAFYAAFIALHEQDYLTHVVPLLLRYYSAFSLASHTILGEATGMLRWFLLPAAAFLVVSAYKRRAVPGEFLYALAALLAAYAQILIQMKGWANHSYPLYAFGILLCFVVMRESFPHRRELGHAAAGLLGLTMILAMLAFSLNCTSEIATHAKDENITRMVELLDREAAGQPVAIFGINVPDAYPALFYSRAKSALRYAHFWMIPGLYADAETDKGKVLFHTPQERNADEAALFSDIAEDLRRQPPKLLIFTHARFQKGAEPRYFDFQRYFVQEPALAKLFSQYRRIGTLGEQDIYRHIP